MYNTLQQYSLSGSLSDHGCPVYRVDHAPGEFVLTFPIAYLGGFNQGITYVSCTYIHIQYMYNTHQYIHTYV